MNTIIIETYPQNQRILINTDKIIYVESVFEEFQEINEVVYTTIIHLDNGEKISCSDDLEGICDLLNINI